MSVHEFPNHGEQFWRAVSPPVRRYLLTQTDAATSDAIMAKLAPVVRRAGDRRMAPAAGDSLEDFNLWVTDIVNGFILELINNELEMIALREEIAGPRPPRDNPAGGGHAA